MQKKIEAMVFEDWINNIIGKGLLCKEYTDKLVQAHSKLKIMDIVLDANGVSWLPEMDSKGYPLPYDTILREFKSYINGNYIAEFKNEQGGGYTSSLYCCYSESDTVDVTSTLAVFLGCSGTKIQVRENSVTHLYIDKNCDVSVFCPDSSHVYIDCWPNANVKVSGNVNNVIIKRR